MITIHEVNRIVPRRFMFGAVVGMDCLLQMFPRALFVLISQCAQHLEQGSIQSLQDYLGGGIV